MSHLMPTRPCAPTPLTLQGFSRIKSSLDEEALDYGPKAKEMFAHMVEGGSKAGWLVMDPEA